MAALSPPQQPPAIALPLLAIVVAPTDRCQILSGTGNCAALQGAGDRGRRNAQVGGGLPWRDAGRQCSGQLLPQPSQAVCAWAVEQRPPGAAVGSEFGGSILAAIERNANCFLLQGAVQVEPRNSQVLRNLALRDSSLQRTCQQIQGQRCSTPRWLDFARPASLLHLSAAAFALPV